MARRLVQLVRFALLLAVAAAFGAGPASADRLKELVQVEGARDNQLIGYGLVGGLAGTGDQTTQVPYTVQAIQNMMRQMGLSLNPQSFLQPTAVAAVMVTGDLPAFMQIGQKIDVTVSAMGNAKSLRGGVLLMTELRGADGQVYAIAQGSLLVSGFEASGQASSTTVNIPTVAQIPSGAIIERTAKSTFTENGAILLDLDQRSFGNAARIADAIDRRMGGIAEATGPAQIAVRAPPGPARVRFVADLLDIDVSPETPVAEVVIDAQSGTVVLGQDVKIGPAAVAYGSLAVTVNETPEVSQPGPFSSGGTTKVVPRTSIKAAEKTAKILELSNAPRISDIVRNLNAIGATSSDLIAILQALKQSGSLHARIKVI
jgi:flagellar P-ring protein FlgI